MPVFEKISRLHMAATLPNQEVKRGFGTVTVSSQRHNTSLRGGKADEAIQKPFYRDGLLPASQARSRNDGLHNIVFDEQMRWDSSPSHVFKNAYGRFNSEVHHPRTE